MYGFTFNTVYRQKWEEPELFSITSLDGKNGADEVENYEDSVCLSGGRKFIL